MSGPSPSSLGAPAGWHVVELDACGSTNDEAARLARAGAAHGTVVIAHRQTNGRGRDGRAWTSPPGLGLYLSAVLRPPLPLADVPPLTLALGVAVCDAARTAGATSAALKWPNDVLVGSRKLAGVLVETQSQGGRLDAVIAGIGVNLGDGAELPAELADTAITLAGAGGVAARASFVPKLLAQIATWVDRYVAGGIDAIAPAWHARMAPGLTARAGELVGTVAGLDRDGALLLRDVAGALHRVRSGDVQVLRH